ncbi:CIA30 family protein [Sungkyunkwania multivorans]|uniref:CIA30 family protein n=1 Tax=Sungkyunkwania multivorans TaxID=1173618 RepID=A0ABW3CUC8_9FLAO
MMTELILFDFNRETDINEWRVVNDGVMGGLSEGSIRLNSDGHAVFSGSISLKNNGGFSSVRHRYKTKEVSGYSKVMLRVKGDGKKYQFRIKSNRYDRHSYIGEFTTSGDWETIEIDFSKMYPAFRGRTLDISNYPGAQLEEIAFLIGNKKAEDFKLLIDSISLR